MFSFVFMGSIPLSTTKEKASEILKLFSFSIPHPLTG